MMEQDRLVKGRQQVEAQGRHAAHAGGLVRDADKGWGAAGAVDVPEDQHPAQAVDAAGVAVDVELGEQQKPRKRQEANMPGGDRIGPVGIGPMTGRAAGFCAGYGAPGYANAGWGRGFGMGFGPSAGLRAGRGRGWRNRFYATGMPGWMRGNWGGAMPSEPAPEQELEMLKGQAEYFEGALADLKKRIEEIEVDKTKK